MLAVFALLPFVGRLIHALIAVWVLIAGVVAIRQGLDFDTGRAIGAMAVYVIGVIGLFVLFWFLVFAMFAGLGAGLRH